MEITPEIFMSCVSELKEIHKSVHTKEWTLEEQLGKLRRGEKLGCPICDVSGSILTNPETAKEFDSFNAMTIGPVGPILALLGMEIPFAASQAAILALGVMIGKKLKEVELMTGNLNN